jgi:adenylylsulfate kinase
MEKRVRSVAKTMSWRIVATSTTILLVFLFTRDFVISASVGSLEVLAKTVIYYVHERIWNVLDFGKVHCTPERE